MILYAILLAAIVATWVAVTTLEAPDPPMPGDELEAFKAAVSEETRIILADREAALASVETLGAPSSESPPSMGRRIDGTTAFEDARDEASRAVVEQVGTMSTPPMSGGLPVSLELDDALNEADRLYESRNAEATSIQETVFREAMESESDDYIRHLGCLALVRTVNRDIIKYRLMESLPLQEIKAGIYETEVQNARAALEESRATASERISGSLTELDCRYGGLLDGIVGGIATQIDEVEMEMIEPSRGLAILESLISRLGGFSPVRLPGGLGLSGAGMPVTDRVAWLAREGEMGDVFSDVTGG